MQGCLFKAAEANTFPRFGLWSILEGNGELTTSAPVEPGALNFPCPFQIFKCGMFLSLISVAKST